MKKLAILGVVGVLVGMFMVGRLSVAKEANAQGAWTYKVFSATESTIAYEFLARFLNNKSPKEYIILPDSTLNGAYILYR